jgi:hypothetical protein
MNAEHEMDKVAPTAATQAAWLGMPNKRRTPAEMEAL